MDDLLLKQLFDISIAAGKQILSVYNDEVAVTMKEDDSPLTVADQLSNETIVNRLKNINANTPILSEEGAQISYEERKNWTSFWLVDPLDGTKEFIKKNDEFTVNIAFVENGYPTLGVIYAPALDRFYLGSHNGGAFKLEQASKQSFVTFEQFKGISKKIQIASIENSHVRVVASRSHLSTETEAFIEQFKNDYETVEVTSAGSSLKFCLVAEGKAHFYPRYAPTMEWDTAAGQAIVEAAGGTVVDYETNARKNYNQPNLRNDWFLVKG